MADALTIIDPICGYGFARRLPSLPPAGSRWTLACTFHNGREPLILTILGFAIRGQKGELFIVYREWDLKQLWFTCLDQFLADHVQEVANG